jgi:DNA-binding MarR family transcriptional regulator
MRVDPVTEDLRRYINDTAGIDLDLEPTKLEGLPLYLRQRYEPYRVRVGGQQIVGLVVRDPAALSPAAFEKHLRQFPARVQHGYVVVARELPAYVRARLIKRHIPFVVPGMQVSWPELGVAVRARRARRVPAVGASLSPAAQAFLVATLMRTLPRHPAAKEAATALGYTPMTMTRAFDELAAAGLAMADRRGHERRLRFNKQGKELWDAVRPWLRNPVRRTVHVLAADAAVGDPLLAGESALGADSLLTAPATPVYAVGPRGWASIRAAKAETLPIEDVGACALQIWSYEPAIAARDGRVDPFSLVLSFGDNEDERVADAINELMEKVQW